MQNAKSNENLSQKSTNMINKRNHIAACVVEQTVQRRREAIFLPHFLPVTTWQTNQLWATNWVTYW